MKPLTIKITEIVLLLIILCACGNNRDNANDNEPAEANLNQVQARPLADDFVHQPQPKHAIRSITHDVFNQTINNPRPLNIDAFVAAGIVPHHITAATLISGFFAGASALAEDYNNPYDLVIILAPNHFGDLADVVLSDRDWDIGSGVLTDRNFVEDLMNLRHINTAISHEHLENDHSASILIPYIHHYLPNTKVAPVLLRRSLSLSETFNLFDWLLDWINKSNQNILLVASIDFSHFLTSAEAAQKDLVTANAIQNKDYQLIHSLSDHYLDSPASLIIFLKYLDALGLSPQIILNTEASEFLGPGLCETTSYKVIIGTQGD